MLTSDLLRYVIRKKQVAPLYLDTESEEAQHKAAELTSIFQESINEMRGEMDELVEQCIGYGTDFMIWRGLAKLLYDRCELSTVSGLPPEAIRAAVFSASHELGPVTSPEIRAAVLARAAEELGTTPEACEQGLYADLQARQRLLSYKPLESQALLHRYNLALAQGILYRATKLEIWLADQDPNLLRYLFQSLKFYGLMHRIWRAEDGGWRVEVDGPASLFSQSRKYGLQMATFLPALVLMERWTLTASLDWERSKRDLTMTLSQDAPLVSHYRARGQWISDEEKMLQDRFASYETEWALERRATLIELDAGQVLIPDYTLTHPDGRVVLLDVIGFWRKSYLERRLEALSSLKGVALVLVVSQRLNADQGAVDAEHVAIVPFKTVIRVDRVLAAAEALTASA